MVQANKYQDLAAKVEKEIIRKESQEERSTMMKEIREEKQAQLKNK